MLSKEEIEKFIQEMTEVRPKKLNQEALRLYNTIMQILDKNEKLEEDKQKIIEKLEKFLKEIKQDGIYGYDGDILEILKLARGEEG